MRQSDDPTTGRSPDSGTTGAGVGTGMTGGGITSDNLPDEETGGAGGRETDSHPSHGALDAGDPTENVGSTTESGPEGGSGLAVPH